MNSLTGQTKSQIVIGQVPRGERVRREKRQRRQIVSFTIYRGNDVTLRGTRITYHSQLQRKYEQLYAAFLWTRNLVITR